jgi:DNA-binding CsgD family transcriptional regulator
MTPLARRYLSLLCRGMTYKEIAAHTGTSWDTVRKLFHQWRVKYHCGNNEQLVYKWLKGEYGRDDAGEVYP